MHRIDHFLLVFTLGVACSANAARGATLDRSFGASAIAIAHPCAARVAITRGAGADRIAVHAEAARAEELDALAFASDPTALSIRHAPANEACWRPPGRPDWQPTLVLAIAVPAGTPISISDGGAAQYAITGVSGPLALSLAGAATTLRADAVLGLEATLAGAPSVAIGRVDGLASLEVAGTGVVAIGRLVASSLRIVATGHVSIDVHGGRIGALSVADTGSGHASVAGTVDNATVTLTGSGTVALPRPAGDFHQVVLGSGTVSFTR